MTINAFNAKLQAPTNSNDLFGSLRHLSANPDALGDQVKKGGFTPWEPWNPVGNIEI